MHPAEEPATVSATALEPAVHPWPMSRAVAAEPLLEPGDMLALPHRQRMITQRDQDPETGVPELRLYYGSQQISFDEPELFTFGETLAQQSLFRAGDALGWGEPGDWPRVRDLLTQLIDAGVLRRADEGTVAAGQLHEERRVGEAGLRPSPLPAARSQRPRSWHELPGLMQELTGRPLESGWLELVVPIFRVAHMALDAEGRQVGEANVFPRALRLDVATRWRSCIYAGSRYQDDKPMNVSALKAMRAHWLPMMAMLLKVRAAYLARCPEARAGWTVGHLERLSTAVLALPAYQLMRREARVPDGRLHPVLSSMFRVTDGVRMTMHHMLFIPFGEPTRRPDTPMDAAQLHAYAERAFSLHGDHGVCAGPRAMIDEFLAVLIDGQAPRDGLPAELEPELQAAVADIEPAIDYAMLGLQSYAAAFSHWPLAMHTYEQLWAIAQRWLAVEPSAAVQRLVDWLSPLVERLRSGTHLATAAWRADRVAVYDDMYAQAQRCRTGQLPAVGLCAQAEASLPGDTALACRLARATQRRAGRAATPAQQGCRDDWCTALQRYAVQAQALVRAGCAAQADINRLLGRPVPERPFAVADIDLYVQLAEETHGRVPFLPDELHRVSGLQLRIDADVIQLQDDGPRPEESAGMGPADARACSTH